VFYTVRILVQPFGQGCANSDSTVASCDELSTKFSSCKNNEIFSWTTQTCESICPSPLYSNNGNCVAVQIETQSTSNVTDTSQCLELNYTEYVDLLAGQQLTNNSVFFSTDSIELLSNGTSYCTSCKWIEYDLVDVDIDIETSSVTVPSGNEYVYGLYIRNNNSQILTCENPLITDEAVPSGILGDICIRVDEEAVSIALLSISIFCLIIMVIMYSILPILHNVPGYIVLSQVGDKVCYAFVILIFHLHFAFTITTKLQLFFYRLCHCCLVTYSFSCEELYPKVQQDVTSQLLLFTMHFLVATFGHFCLP